MLIILFTVSQNITMCNLAAATSISTMVNSGFWSCNTNNSVPNSKICDWLGVWCDSSSQVFKIDLSVLRGITGSISNSIGYLQSLVSLRLGNNSFSNSIPTGLGLLSQLTYLDVSYNQLSGPLPSELGKSQLREVLINSNYLTGPLPSGLCSDSYLNYLDAKHNPLSCYASCLTSVATLGISSSLFACTTG